MSRVLDSRRVLVYTFNQVVECHRVRMVGVGVAIAQPHGVDAENAAPDTRRIARITARTKIEGRLYFEAWEVDELRAHGSRRRPRDWKCNDSHFQERNQGPYRAGGAGFDARPGGMHLDQRRVD